LTEGSDKVNNIFPEPFYHPCKVIPLLPAIIKIVFEQCKYNFDRIINGIREYAWVKLKLFNKEESCKKFLFLICCTIQAFWTDNIKLPMVPSWPNLSGVTPKKW
jgi:hypothetical protein